jgi:DNA invertase Pin-like site-specific DNA recombinase
MARVILASRVSFDRKENTSIERQDTELLKWAHAQSHEVVAQVRDKAVSGDIDLFDRPGLGEWLTEERRSRWDSLAVTTQDRLSRNDIHFLAFVFKIIEWGKTLVVLDDPSLDLLSVEGRLIAHAKAIGPAKELERIKARIRDSHVERRYTPQWHGGTAPYGYTTESVVLDGGTVRRVLVLDGYTCSVAHEMRRWMVDEGETLMGVARKLNDRGELTGSDLWRRRKKMSVRNELWSSTGVKMILTSPSCLGIKLQGRKAMHSSDGSPFKIAHPLFDDVEWETLQAAIAARTTHRTRKWGASPLLDVVFCGLCGAKATRNMTVKRGKEYAYYVCKNRHPRQCPGARMREGDVIAIVEAEFLSQVGGERVHRKMFVPGASHEIELRELKGKIQRLRQDREQGLFDGEDDEIGYRKLMTSYLSRRRELERLPTGSTGWRYEVTDETYGEAWERGDDQKRRQLLMDAGFRFEVLSVREWTVAIPDDMISRLRETKADLVPMSG